MTNAEERQYLSGLVPDEKIGSVSLSCIYITMLQAGSGIRVTTNHINWCTEDIYVNALITAGIEDASVMVTEEEIQQLISLCRTLEGIDVAQWAEKLELGDTMRSVQEAGESVSTFFQSVGDFFTGIGDFIGRLLTSIGDFFTRLFSGN